MIVLYFHIFFVIDAIFSNVFGHRGRDPFLRVDVTDLLFKTYMIKPNSWLHILFIKKNRRKNYPHIIHNAILVITAWIYCILNTIIVSLALYYEQVGGDAMIWKIIAYSLMGLYLLIQITVNFILGIKSHEIAYIQSLMSPEEKEKLHKELEEKVPGFYEGYKYFN